MAEVFCVVLLSVSSGLGIDFIATCRKFRCFGISLNCSSTVKAEEGS
jgi:hypothetical protein